MNIIKGSQNNITNNTIQVTDLIKPSNNTIILNNTSSNVVSDNYLISNENIGDNSVVNNNTLNKINNSNNKPNSIISTNPVNGGKVVFKINGSTLKDKNGNPIKAYVKNGIAQTEYKLPTGMKAGFINVTTVYGSNNYYRAETKNKLNITKSNTQTIIKSITTKTNQKTTITGTIKDSNNNLINGTTKIAIKINEKPITIPNNYKNSKYTLTVIAGENNTYKSSVGNSLLNIIK